MGKISSHIPSLRKPQDLYTIKPDNSEKPFDHVLLPKNPKTKNPIHPLHSLTLTPSDFIHQPSIPHRIIEWAPLEETPLKLVENFEDLEQLAMALEKVDQFAVDLEHNQYRSYQGLTCLMQISTRVSDFIIDTLKLHHHVGPYLRGAFLDPKKAKVMHGAGSDVLWLQRDFGIYVCNLFDTMQASQVLNLGGNKLSYLVNYYCGVHLDKAYQNSDWRIRPLEKEMVKYAREDAHYLLYIYDRIRNDLVIRDFKLLMRVYEESYDICVKLYKKKSFRGISCRDVKGLREGRLDEVQYDVARELHRWRDEMGRLDDESVKYVMSDNLLVMLAKKMPKNKEEIVEIVKEQVEDCSYVNRRLDEVVKIINQKNCLD